MIKKVLTSSLFVVSIFSLGIINNTAYADDFNVDVNGGNVNVDINEGSDNVNSTTLNSGGGYKEVECSTNSVYKENSCNQCFVGGEKAQGAYVGFLDDNWINSTTNDIIMYEDIQSMPFMVNLNTSKVNWSQKPSADKFWEYTDDIKKLYDKDKLGYVLKSGNQVVRIKSKTGSAYSLEKNEASKGSDIGLVVFPIKAYNILEDGEISVDNEEHRECVLFKSSGASKPLPKEKPKKLPDTGPAQFLILLVLAMVLAFGVLRFRKS